MIIIVMGLYVICMSYVTNLALWLQYFNKLTYLLTYLLTCRETDKEMFRFGVWLLSWRWDSSAGTEPQRMPKQVFSFAYLFIWLKTMSVTCVLI